MHSWRTLKPQAMLLKSELFAWTQAASRLVEVSLRRLGLRRPAAGTRP
jgi:hypothetical protein